MRPQIAHRYLLGDGAALIRAYLLDNDSAATEMLKHYPPQEMIALAVAAAVVGANVLQHVADTIDLDPHVILDNFLAGLDAATS